MRRNIIIIFAASLMLTGCGLHNEYVPKAIPSADVFGTTQDVMLAEGGASMAQMSWREFFTDPLLQELIDHIDVYKTEGVGKSRTQRVAVYYRFVGYIEIPELPKRRHNVKADTRQGVSVEYVPQIATA